MVMGALSFSAGSALIKLAGTRLPALEIVFARSLFMSIYCWYLARRAGAHIPGHAKLLLFFRGTLGFGAYFCVFYAVIHLPLADALAIVFAFPLIVPMLAAIFLKEPMESVALFAAALGAAGMLCVTRPGFLFGEISGLDPLAVWIAVGAALFSAFSVLCIRKLTATEHPLVIVLYAGMISTVGAPLIDGWNWLLPTGLELVLLLSVGFFMSVGQHLITLAIAKSTAARASILLYMEVVFAAVFGYLLFHEIPDQMTVLGVAIIVAGAILLSMKKSAAQGEDYACDQDK